MIYELVSILMVYGQIFSLVNVDMINQIMQMSNVNGLMCPCLEFKIEQKSQEKIESKTDRELKPEFGINAKMFQEFHGAGKKAKKTVSRSEGYDDIEKHWTNIGDAKKSDYKLKISEATEILKKDFTNVDAWIEKGINYMEIR